MKLSVIIPCYNAEGTIGEQMDAMASQSRNEPWEIVVADNRCTDNTIAIVQRYQNKVPNLRMSTHQNSKVSLTRLMSGRRQQQVRL